MKIQTLIEIHESRATEAQKTLLSGAEQLKEAAGNTVQPWSALNVLRWWSPNFVAAAELSVSSWLVSTAKGMLHQGTSEDEILEEIKKVANRRAIEFALEGRSGSNASRAVEDEQRKMWANLAQYLNQISPVPAQPRRIRGRKLVQGGKA